MKKFKTIILIVYVLLFSNLLIQQKLFGSVIIFLPVNLYFSLTSKLNQKNINKLSFVELLFWSINISLILINNFDAWFVALNNLLWLVTSIKMVELKNDYKNKNIVLFLLLSVGSSSIFNINFTSNVIHILSIFLLIYSLLVFNKYRSANIIKQLIILVSFLPLTFISFLIVPSPKPWLSLNSNNFARTGINSELKPGDISTLAQSEDLVARVFFSSDLPKPENRYWRVFVLDNFENNTWKSSTKFDEKNANKSIFLANNNDINLETLDNERWILEPNFIRHRPWSGRGNTYNDKLFISEKGVLLGSKELRKRAQYQIEYSNNAWREVSPEEINFDLNKIKNKSLFKLSRKWLKESSNPQEILEKSRIWFSKEGFTYSINPGLMSKNSPYDDFLFQKKKGFCEHFAGSFALLMRYANIPARVIVGYQGGEIYNDVKDEKYLLIDNSYAHAWNEVWIKDKGWIRIDPTSWISPERIQESSLLTNKYNSRFINFRRAINRKFINNLNILDIRFTELAEEIRKKFKIPIFSENKIINRTYNILLLLSTFLLSIFILLLSEFKNKNDSLKTTLNLYFYFLNLFKLKKRKGDTLKSFSLRVIESYPGTKSEIMEVYRSYNYCKFRNKNLSTKKLLLIQFKLIYFEIKVLFNVLIINLKTNSIKYIKTKK